MAPSHRIWSVPTWWGFTDENICGSTPVAAPGECSTAIFFPQSKASELLGYLKALAGRKK